MIFARLLHRSLAENISSSSTISSLSNSTAAQRRFYSMYGNHNARRASIAQISKDNISIIDSTTKFSSRKLSNSTFFSADYYGFRRSSSSLSNLVFRHHQNLFRASEERSTIRFFALDAPSSNKPPTSVESEEDAIRDEAKKQHTKSMKKNTSRVLYGLVFIIVGGTIMGLYQWGMPRVDDDGNTIRDEFSDLPWWKQLLARTWNECKLWHYYIVEPSSEKLLPDPLPAPYYQPKYTLVLELNGILIHPEWNYSTGWRFKKRPALDKFVNDIGYPHFEVVIYTSEQPTIAHPLLDNIDPEWRFMHRLYRDATKYMKRAHVKDLSKLNRDLSKVILVDWDAQAFQLNPENALRVPKWDGSDEDRDLIDLASLLLMVADSNVDDIRPVVQYYSQFDDPIKAYVENRKKILEEKMHKIDQKQEQQKESLTKSFAGRLFGYKRHTSA